MLWLTLFGILNWLFRPLLLFCFREGAAKRDSGSISILAWLVVADARDRGRGGKARNAGCGPIADRPVQQHCCGATYFFRTCMLAVSDCTCLSHDPHIQSFLDNS